MIRVYCLIAVVMLSHGCSQSQPASPSTATSGNSPAGQFEWVMQRLERAVLDFRPSQRSGLMISTPKITHELFPPDATRTHYEARVTIESEAAYVHDRSLLASGLEKKRQERLEREKAQRKFEQQSEIEDPLAEQFMEQMEEIAAEPRIPRIPEAVIETQQASDRKAYELAYLKGRWELQTEPETDHERLWFEYALGTSPR
jgi:hypothetical protein